MGRVAELGSLGHFLVPAAHMSIKMKLRRVADASAPVHADTDFWLVAGFAGVEHWLIAKVALHWPNHALQRTRRWRLGRVHAFGGRFAELGSLGRFAPCTTTIHCDGFHASLRVADSMSRSTARLAAASDGARPSTPRLLSRLQCQPSAGDQWRRGPIPTRAHRRPSAVQSP